MADRTILNLLHFNDVYRVSPQKLPGGGTIDVTQFAALVDSLRDAWPSRDDELKDGLLLFSGDLFSPSVESSVTRGSHLVPVINELRPDIALTGNHDFDFGYHHFVKLVDSCKFPWILSNIKDTETGETPKSLKRFEVFERCGVRIGVIGLVEQEWIATVTSWPPNFQYQHMHEVGIELSQLLRNPQGEYKCDLILALTHSRIPNDIKLAKQLGAVPDGKSATQHGVDIIFGGHDHMYYIGRGIESWDNYDFDEEQLGAEDDDGLLIVKSGTDFRDLSSLEVELIDAPEGSVRRKVVKSIKGKHHVIVPGMPSSPSMKQLLSTLLADVSSALKAPVCRTLTEVNCKSTDYKRQSASGNWFADVLRHTYDDALCVKGRGGADGVLICGGTIRGDSVYGPGLITLGDIMEILPFEDSIVVISVDGATLWRALESALCPWPAQEGLEWDCRKPPNERIIGIWEEIVEKLPEQPEDDSDPTPTHSGASTPVPHTRRTKGDPVSKDPGGKMYTIVTREYMATGHDGYEALKDCKYVGGIDDEHGMIMSSIFNPDSRDALGMQYINKMKRAVHRHSSTDSSRPPLSVDASQRARANWEKATRKIIARINMKQNKTSINEAFATAATQQMTSVDCFDGESARRGGGKDHVPKRSGTSDEDADIDLVIIAPMVDGRLKNVGAPGAQ
ncbi:hypothetical protein FRB99_006006 [Tulasnella sp. 403]|nr:hypothetical protein FRB99_006006 [Tulasnella sp. 403]